jgi:CheY-like chemotaxis protein
MAKTVLVVDDERDFLDLMADLLQVEGYHVIPCPVPTEAFRLAKQQRPDGIILDLVMPGCSGWQVMEQLKADPQMACIPVVVTTGKTMRSKQEIVRLKQLATDVLFKPFELDDLFASLAKAITDRKAC